MYGRANGFYPDLEGRCDKYASCVNNVMYSMNCELDTVYDTAINRCNIPELVSGRCGLAPPAAFSCQFEPDGYHRSKLDCAVHYKCDNGVLKGVQTCQSLQAFDTTTERCLPIQQVDDCQPDKDLSLGEQFCSVFKSDGVYANPGSCHQGILCLLDRLLVKYNAFVNLCADPEEPDWYPETNRCGPARAGCTLAAADDDQ